MTSPIAPIRTIAPAGFGIYDAGRPTKAENNVLSGLTVKAGSVDDLTRSAADAVHSLTSAGALASKDITPPYAVMVPTKVIRGRRSALYFAVADDSKKATAVIRVLDSGRQIATFSFRYQAAVLGRQRSATWLVPRALKPGVLQARLSAADLSGNRSHKSCAALTVV